jgi:hypothetical protein
MEVGLTDVLHAVVVGEEQDTMIIIDFHLKRNVIGFILMFK